MIRRDAQSVDTVAPWEYERRVPQQECTVSPALRCHMDIDAEKLEQTVLALLYLNSFADKSGVSGPGKHSVECDGSATREGLHFRSSHEKQVRVAIGGRSQALGGILRKLLAVNRELGRCLATGLVLPLPVPTYRDLDIDGRRSCQPSRGSNYSDRLARHTATVINQDSPQNSLFSGAVNYEDARHSCSILRV